MTKELLSKKDYTLLAEANCFDSKGDLKKTKVVTLHCLKLEDSDEALDLLESNKRYKALEFLCDKSYIAPSEIEGKIKINDLDFRVAMDLLGEYSSNFLDLSPFLKAE